MRVAAIQYKGDKRGWGAHKRSLLSLIEAALKRGALLVVTPEMCATGYLFHDQAEAARFVEPWGGAWAKALSALASRYQALLVVGLIDEVEGALCNSAWLFLPSGEQLRYHKRLLYTADERWATSGRALPQHAQLNPYPVISFRGWRVTVGICMDLNDDAFIEHCERHDVDLIAFPTNWLDQEVEVASYWAWRLRNTRAYLVAANTYGVERYEPLRSYDLSRDFSRDLPCDLPCEQETQDSERGGLSGFELVGSSEREEREKEAREVRFRGESALLLSQPPMLYAQAPYGHKDDGFIEAELPHPKRLSPNVREPSAQAQG